MISLNNVSFRFDEESPWVLNQVNLTINQGEFVALLGKNGSGKSTLARLLNGLFLPTEGSVIVDDMDTKDTKKLWDIRQKVGLVFQNPDNQIVAAVVEDDVAFGPENIGVLPVEIRRRVDEALNTVGMYQHRKKSPHLLSGGQKQRIAIAGVLAMHPQYIVLDEPTAMLDPKGRKEVMNAISRINREAGITVILITHNMEEAALADRAIILERGRVFCDKNTKELFRDESLLKECSLDVPDTVSLIKRLQENGISVSLDGISAEECASSIYKIYEELE